MSIVEINLYAIPEETVRLYPMLDDIKLEIAIALMRTGAINNQDQVNVHVHSSASSF